MAWLNAAPKGEGRRTRFAEMREAGIAPELPDNPLPYLTDLLFEIGPVVPAGMGVGVIEWSDLAAWQTVVGTPLQAWEARTIRTLSAVYLDQRHKAETPGCPSPMNEAPEVVADRVTAQFSAMVQALKGDRGMAKAG